MTRYLILLKGINVSGQKKIKMTELKELLLLNGYSNIITYLQTGNILLESDNKTEIIGKNIEELIFKKYKFEVSVFVITKYHITEVLDNFPFKGLDLENIGNKILISFLSEPPLLENITKVMEYVKAPDKLEVLDNIVYLYCPGGYGKSKLSNKFLENRLKVISTTRNLNTLNKINNMD
ncbi:MAG: DUF1697 domain-containing protein [Spirochaetaceae bacterium]